VVFRLRDCRGAPGKDVRNAMVGTLWSKMLKRLEKARREVKRSAFYRVAARYAEYSFVLPGVMLILGGPLILLWPEGLSFLVASLSISVGIPCIYAAIKFVGYKRAAEAALKQIQASILIQTVNPADDQLVELVGDGDDKVTMH
jgi:hypothetical protein